jgi:hypothetical protein
VYKSAVMGESSFNVVSLFAIDDEGSLKPNDWSFQKEI